jgi:hypothetical protein
MSGSRIWWTIWNPSSESNPFEPPVAKELSLVELWNSTALGDRTIRSDKFSGLPEAARRYLEHAIAPGTVLASSVRLRMHGQIKLERWLPFVAEQVIRGGQEMIWRAAVRRSGMTIRGFDRFVDGEGAMQWKLFGIIPVMKASGPNINRSAAGRVKAESVWLPSILCGDDVSWTAEDSLHPNAHFTVRTDTQPLALTIDDKGRLKSIKLQRWGNPEGGEFHDAPFGGVVEKEGTFGGYTIPTCVRIGWHFGTDRFEPDGEFFRATVDDAKFR